VVRSEWCILDRELASDRAVNSVYWTDSMFMIEQECVLLYLRNSETLNENTVCNTILSWVDTGDWWLLDLFRWVEDDKGIEEKVLQLLHPQSRSHN
jgi:hypothetical protein